MRDCVAAGNCRCGPIQPAHWPPRIALQEPLRGGIAKEEPNTDKKDDIADDADGRRLNDILPFVIGGAFAVFKTLGTGFIEKVCGNASAHELSNPGLAMEQPRGLSITHDSGEAGEYVADLIVGRALLVALKAVNHRTRRTMRYASMTSRHPGPLGIRDLKASGPRLDLTLNFSMKPLESERLADNLEAAPSA